jgi:hypothetical protein
MRTPRFSSSTRAPKQQGDNRTERPSLIPLPLLTPLRSSLPSSRSRAPTPQTNTLSGAQSNVSNSEMNLEQETRGGENLQVPVGSGVHSHHASQVRVSPDSDAHQLDWGGIRVGVASRPRFSFIKHMNRSPLHQPPISCHSRTGPVGTLLSTPRSIRKASPSGSGSARPVLPSPFSQVTASIIALGTRSRYLLSSEDREKHSCQEFAPGRTARRVPLSRDGHQNLTRDSHTCTSPRATKLAFAIPPDDGDLGGTDVQHSSPLAGTNVSGAVAISNTTPPISLMNGAQLAGGALDLEASLDFPSTASVIFPSLLCEPFDSSDTSLAKHFNDIDLGSPTAQRLLRSSTASLESLDTLVRYMFEGNVDSLHSSPAKGHGRAPQERRVHGESIRLPASVTSAGLIARLESTPRSANSLYRGPQRSTAPNATSRVGNRGKLHNSDPLQLREGLAGDWPQSAHRGPKVDTENSREDFVDGVVPAYPNTILCDNFRYKTSLLDPSLPIKKTPSPPSKRTHFISVGRKTVNVLRGGGSLVPSLETDRHINGDGTASVHLEA